MFDAFFAILLVFFLLINPISLTPLFITLTTDTSAAYQKRMAIKSCVIAWVVLLIFAFTGYPLLSALGISLESFRVGGGLLLGVTGFRMVLEQRQKQNKQRAEELQSHHEEADISVFPLATLFIAGPGAITATMLMMNEYGGTLIGKVSLVSALSLITAATMLMFLLSSRVAKYIPETITSVITRVLGILIIALSVQFVFDGIFATFFPSI